LPIGWQPSPLSESFTGEIFFRYCPLLSMAGVPIKLSVEGIHRFRLHDISWDTLRGHICSVAENVDAMVVKYRDEVGDAVAIGSQHDLEECLRISSAANPLCLSVELAFPVMSDSTISSDWASPTMGLVSPMQPATKRRSLSQPPITPMGYERSPLFERSVSVTEKGPHSAIMEDLVVNFRAEIEQLVVQKLAAERRVAELEQRLSETPTGSVQAREFHPPAVLSSHDKEAEAFPLAMLADTPLETIWRGQDSAGDAILKAIADAIATDLHIEKLAVGSVGKARAGRAKPSTPQDEPLRYVQSMRAYR